jgi:DNA-binding NarL/FixJ family response regulator
MPEPDQPKGVADIVAEIYRPAHRAPMRAVAPYATTPCSEPPATGWSSLTEAELRVVRLVVSGLTNRQIASRLYLSWHTVNSHVRHVLEMLELHARVELTRAALQHDPRIAESA